MDEGVPGLVFVPRMTGVEEGHTPWYWSLKPYLTLRGFGGQKVEVTKNEGRLESVGGIW